MLSFKLRENASNVRLSTYWICKCIKLLPINQQLLYKWINHLQRIQRFSPIAKNIKIKLYLNYYFTVCKWVYEWFVHNRFYFKISHTCLKNAISFFKTWYHKHVLMHINLYKVFVCARNGSVDANASADGSLKSPL